MAVPKKQTTSIPKTARERIYQTLKEWIQQNTLKPGEKIYDKELAEYFEVSRTPVREAMQLLADQRLIEIRPGKDSIVTPIDLEQIKEIYVILGSIQSLGVRFAFPKITAQIIEQLEQINEQISKASSMELLKFDQAFHQCILDAAGNPFLDNFYSMLNTHITRFQLSYVETGLDFDKKETLLAHQNIIDALKDKDLARAEKEINQNYLFMLDKIDHIAAHSL